MQQKKDVIQANAAIQKKTHTALVISEIAANLVPLVAVSTILLLIGLGVVVSDKFSLFLVICACLGYVLAAANAVTILLFFRRILLPLSRTGIRFFSIFNEEEKDILSTASNGSYMNIVMNSIDLFGGKKSVYDRAANMEATFEQAMLCSADISFRNNVGNDESVLVIPNIWRERYPDLDLLQVDVIESRIHPDDKLIFDESFNSLKKKAGRSMNMSVQFRVSPREFINANINARSIHTSSEQIVIVGAIIDTNSITELENTVREKYLMYHFALQAVTDIIFEVDLAADTITITNPNRYVELFGEAQDSRNYSMHHKQYTERIHPEYREDFLDRFYNLDHLLYMPDMRMTYEYKVRNGNGEWVWVRHTMNCIKTENNRAEKVIGLITDINERRASDIRKIYDARHDSATGLYLKSVIEREYANELVSGSGTPCLLLMKILNYDQLMFQFGMKFTDRTMFVFAEMLRANRMDNCTIARFEDDVFGVFIKDASISNTGQFLATRFLREAQKLMDVDGTVVRIEISAGAALAYENPSDYETTLKRAEDALEKACDEAYKYIEAE